MKQKCKYCKQNIIYNHWREFASHCGNCKANKNVLNKYKKISKALSHEKKLYKTKCEKCGKIFEQELTENVFKRKTKRYKKTCSSFCSHSRTHSNETNKKRSETIKNNIKSGLIVPHNKSGRPQLKGKESPYFKKGSYGYSKIIREKTFNKYNGICQDCGKNINKKKSFYWVAHHKNFLLTQIEYHLDEDRILLCRKCHNILHGKLRPVLKELNMLGRK